MLLSNLIPEFSSARQKHDVSTGPQCSLQHRVEPAMVEKDKIWVARWRFLIWSIIKKIGLRDRSEKPEISNKTELLDFKHGLKQM